MQIIFKAITGSSGHAFWWERTVMHSIWRPWQREPPKAATNCIIFATDFSLTSTVPHFLGASPELPVIALKVSYQNTSHLNREDYSTGVPFKALI